MSIPLWFQSIGSDDSGPGGQEAPRRRLGLIRPGDDAARVGNRAVNPHAGLVERIRQGDAEAFGELVELVLDEAIRVAVYVTDNRDVAQDVVQDAFIRLWERRAQLDVSRPLLPYLFAMVRNRALDDRKAQRVRERYRERAALELSEAATPSGEEGVLTTLFEAAMAELSERQRTAIRLRYQEQMSFADVGVVLGLSANAAHQMVLRGVRALRERLGISLK